MDVITALHVQANTSMATQNSPDEFLSVSRIVCVQSLAECWQAP